ncbi:MAG: gamma-glutamylcyclotransferase [Deltaproteobacteria bacterium]|nr:gamma-glutamylcyclotransferase [Deltaproteobacteria bacterium]
MSAALFSYGTLMLAPVRRLHSRRAFATEPATLAGFARVALRGASYPGLVPDARGVVTGVLVRGIAPALLAKLDRWEGAEYTRQPVRVTLASGESAPAFVYVRAPRARSRALAQDWEASAFERRDLARWLKTARHRNAKESPR